MSKTQVRAASAGLLTDLRIEVGQYAAAGSPQMTLIALNDLWISAEMSENNLGHLQTGTPVAIVLDARPGHIYQGRIRSIGYGISVGQSTPPGSLPTVENNRDWLRAAQRFPVIVEFEAEELGDYRGLRVGGQAEVMAFPTEGNPLNLLGARVFARDELAVFSLTDETTQLPIPRPQRALRLACGVALGTALGFGLALPLPFVTPMLVLLLLAMGNQPLTLKAGLTLALVVSLTCGSGLLLSPLLRHSPLSGVLLVALCLFFSFRFALRGGNGMLSTLQVIGLTMVSAASTVSLTLGQTVVEALIKAVLLTTLCVALSHWLFPEPSGLPAASKTAGNGERTLRLDRPARHAGGNARLAAGPD